MSKWWIEQVQAQGDEPAQACGPQIVRHEVRAAKLLREAEQQAQSRAQSQCQLAQAGANLQRKKVQRHPRVT